MLSRTRSSMSATRRCCADGSCGDPAATGEVRDLRPVGWRREERRDGQRYQSLLTMLEDGQVDDVGRQLKWWNERVRTEQWAKRYGGRFEEVGALLQRARRAQGIRRWASAGALALSAVAVGVMVYLLWDRNRQEAENTKAKQLAEENFVRSVNNAKLFLDDVLWAANRHNMNLDAAGQMERTAEQVVADLSAQASDKAKALRVAYDIVTGDILSTAQPGAERKPVLEAKDLSAYLVGKDPENDEWRYLHFQSKFRYGDILSDEDNAKGALQEFQQAEAIVRQLADKHPEIGKYQYALAFITAKI